MNTITFGQWEGCFLVIFIHTIKNSGGYFYQGRLFLWILDINLKNFVRGYFPKFLVRALILWPVRLFVTSWDRNRITSWNLVLWNYGSLLAEISQASSILRELKHPMNLSAYSFFWRYWFCKFSVMKQSLLAAIEKDDIVLSSLPGHREILLSQISGRELITTTSRRD